MSDPGAPASAFAGYRAAVTAAIFDDAGKVLLTRRADDLIFGGQWCLPGGHLEVGERWDQVCVREVKEEVGLDVAVVRLVGIYSDPAVYWYPARDGTFQMLLALFECRVTGGEIRTTAEVSENRWCTPDEVPEPLVESHRQRLADAFARRHDAVWR